MYLLYDKSRSVFFAGKMLGTSDCSHRILNSTPLSYSVHVHHFHVHCKLVDGTLADHCIIHVHVYFFCIVCYIISFYRNQSSGREIEPSSYPAEKSPD